MIKEDIILVGGGGHCKSCIDVIEREDRYRIAGILDKKEKIGEEVLGYNIIGTDDDIPLLGKKCRNFLVTLGQIKSADLRIKLFNTITVHSLATPVIISPGAFVSKRARISEGTIIMHGAIINAGAGIGLNCIINSRALIEHDAVVGDHCHVSTGALINGDVIIGKKSFVGSGAVVVHNTRLPEKSFIKANSLVK